MSTSLRQRAQYLRSARTGRHRIPVSKV